MTQSAVRIEIGEPLDVHGDLTPKITLDLVPGVEYASNRRDLLLVEIVGLLVPFDAGLVDNLLGARPADANDVGARDFHPLRFR